MFLEKIRAWMVLLGLFVVSVVLLWGSGIEAEPVVFLLKVTCAASLCGFCFTVRWPGEKYGWRVYAGKRDYRDPDYYYTYPRRRLYIFDQFFQWYLADLFVCRFMAWWCVCAVAGVAYFFDTEWTYLFSGWLILLFVYAADHHIPRFLSDKWQRRYDEYIGRIAESARNTVTKCRARRGEEPPPKREQEWGCFRDDGGGTVPYARIVRFGATHRDKE